MSSLSAIEGFCGPPVDRHAMLDGQGGAAAAGAAAAAAALGPGQVVAPGPVIGAFELGVDEAIDGLAADHGVALFALEAAGDLGG